MPSALETVVNKALSGDELKKLILADAQQLVDAEGMLSSHIAFGRVGYTLTLKLHVDNPFIPQSAGVTIASKPVRDAAGELGVVESAPLAATSPAAEVGAMELHRDIVSPNEERVRNGIPVPVLTRQQDSTKQMETIIYPKDAFPELGAGDVSIKDVTERTRQEWGLPPATQPSQAK